MNKAFEWLGVGLLAVALYLFWQKCWQPSQQLAVYEGGRESGYYRPEWDGKRRCPGDARFACAQCHRR